MENLLDDIQTLAEDRPVIARLLVGTVGATALMMVTSIIWAMTAASWISMFIGVFGIGIASFLAITTALPLNCKIGPAKSRSLTCRLQGRRAMVDTVALILTVLVIANIVTMTI